VFAGNTYFFTRRVLMSSEEYSFRDELMEKIKNGGDFRGFDFSGKFLPGIKFYYRHKKGEDPIVPDMTGANFSGAMLHNCDFLDGNLQNANFEGADLKGSYLFGADLRDANFTKAYLGNCHIYGSHLNGACFNEVKCQESLVSACELNKCEMLGADFTGSSFKDSNIVESNLAYSNFTDAYMEGARLVYSKLRNANFTKAVLFRGDLGKADARFAIFRGAVLGKYDTEVGQFYGANMGRADFTGADFRNAELIGVNMHSAIAHSTNFKGANLRNANLCNLKINEKTNMFDANLVRARIKNVDFTRLRLGGANLFETMINFEEIPQSIWEEQQGDFMQAWEAYSQLKTNFKSLGDRRGERWASKKERRLRGVCRRLMQKSQREKAAAMK
jgi:uncharacterized protein YjbI with pentapeptide repeats